MKTFIFGIGSIILMIIAIVQMANDHLGAGLLFLCLGIGAILIAAEEPGLRHRGSIHFFD